MRGLKRLTALFFAALMLLGAVLLALPYFTLGGIERRLAAKLRDQAQVADYRLDQRESMDRIYAENPALLGFRQSVNDDPGTFRYELAGHAPPVSAPAGLLLAGNPPIFVCFPQGERGRIFYFEGHALAGLITARRLLTVYGLVGLAGMALGLWAFVQRLSVPYHEMSEMLADARLAPRESLQNDFQLNAALKGVIAQLRAREGELEKNNRDARERAEQSEAVFSALLAGADFPIALYRRGGKLAQTSAALRLLLQGRDRLPPELAARLDAALETGAPLLDERWAMADNEPLALSLLPIADKSGSRSRGLLLLDREVATAGLRRKLDERLRLTSLGELSGVIAHETRNALGTIRGRMQLLERALTRGEGNAEEAVRGVMAEVDELERMVRAVLDLSRPEEAHLQPLDLYEAAHDAADRYALEPGRPALNLLTQRGTPCTVRADPRMLAGLLDNLLRNAAAADPAGPLELSLAADAQGTELRLRDHGPGFPPALLGEGGPSGESPGGFGLPLCRKWASLMEGELTLRNDPDGGALVVLRLPSVNHQDAAQATALEQAALEDGNNTAGRA